MIYCIAFYGSIMKGICPLASGSKGNAIYIGSDEAKILIDIGLNFKTLKERLSKIGVDPASLDAVIITHEHSDHISGLETLTSKLGIPVFTNRETAKGIYESLKIAPKFKIFTTSEPFEFRDMKIHPFSIPHDSLDPIGLTITIGTTKIGICTDLGHATTLVKMHLEKCDYLYVEANHQVSLVHSSARPMMLKERVLGRQGHLSNVECGDLLSTVYHDGLKAAYLAHLSTECNTKALALKTVGEILEKKMQKVRLLIAHQDQTSEPIFF